MPVADFVLALQKQEPLQSQDRADRVLSQLLGPFEAMTPFFRPGDGGSPGRRSRRGHVVQTGVIVEDPSPIDAPYGQKEMPMGMKVDPVPEGLDGSDDTGD